LFGSEYASDLATLEGRLANLHLSAISSGWLRPFIRRYVGLLGIPEVGMRLRALHFQRIVRTLPLHHACILDAGCGLGLHTLYLARHFPQAEIHAMDIDEGALEACRRLLAARLPGRRVHLHHQDLLNLADRERYDFIYSIDVLEHLPQPAMVLANIYRALKPGGLVYLHLPHATECHCFGRFQGCRPRGHLREYTLPEFIEVVRQAGLHIRWARKTFGRFGALAFQANMVCLRVPALAALLFPLLLGVACVDTWMQPQWGNGILLLAERPAPV